MVDSDSIWLGLSEILTCCRVAWWWLMYVLVISVSRERARTIATQRLRRDVRVD